MMLDAAAQASPGTLALAILLLLVAGTALLGAAFRSGSDTEATRRDARLRLILPAEVTEEAASAPVEEIANAVDERWGFKARAEQIAVRAGGWPALRIPLAVGLGAAPVTWGASHFIFMADNVIGFPAALAAGAFMTWQQVQGAIRKNKLAFLDLLPESIDLIVRAAQAGIPVTDAMAVIGREIPAPVGPEFAEISHMVQMGVDLRDALHAAAERVAMGDFDCFVVSIVIQRETGGQLSETLQNLAGIIRRRKETRAKARVLTAEGRLAAKVMAGLPAVAGGILALFDPSYISVLFTETTGRHMLILAIGLATAGYLVINRLTKADF